MEEIVGVFGINWKLLVIQGINFGFLLLILWYFLYKPVILMLEKRREITERGVRDAEEAEKKLADINAERDTMIKEARMESEHIIKEAKTRGSEEEKHIVFGAQEKSSTILLDAQKEASMLKEQARAESEAEIAKTAILAAEKILRKK